MHRAFTLSSTPSALDSDKPGVDVELLVVRTGWLPVCKLLTSSVHFANVDSGRSTDDNPPVREMGDNSWLSSGEEGSSSKKFVNTRAAGLGPYFF